VVKLVPGNELQRLEIVAAHPGLSGFVSALSSERPDRLIRNFDAEIYALVDHGLVLPITVNNGNEATCFVSSPSAFYVDYARDQIRRMNDGSVPPWLSVLSEVSRLVLALSKIDKIVYVNNWPVWTVPYPSLDEVDVEEVTAAIVKKFPDYLISFRSLNHVFHRTLLGKLEGAGYTTVPADHTFVCDFRNSGHGTPVKLRRDLRRDLKLLDKTENYTPVFHDDIQDNDVPRISELYDALNIRKYTTLNPQYSVGFFEMIRQTGVARLTGLRSKAGTIDAISGNVVMNNVLTNLFVGYDTSLSKDEGLYRLLHALIFREVIDGGYGLNLAPAAGGTADFKRLRGAQAVLEYHAFYAKHLTWHRRALLSSFKSSMDRFGVAIMHRFDF
jgi:hypothetical protein